MPTDAEPAPRDLVERLRTDLRRAMKDREDTEVRTLRIVLAAVANAEAHPLDELPDPLAHRPNEYPPRFLTAAELEGLLREEIDDRRDTISQFEARGRDGEAGDLRAEIVILERYLG
jgi:uncharacterized protein YqeY